MIVLTSFFFGLFFALIVQPLAANELAAFPMETSFLENRMAEPQNHFLLDGSQGFISGQEFYEADVGSTPFLWGQPRFVQYGPRRNWLSDSVPVVFRVGQGSEIASDDIGTLSQGEAGWEVLDGFRLHCGYEEVGSMSSRSYSNRKNLIGNDKGEKQAWLSSKLPVKSLAEVGAAFTRFGSTIGLQANRGWFWTASPVSGQVYPWEGYNAELVYRVGKDFELTLVDQEWDIPISRPFYRAHWSRSELNLGFPSSSYGGWIWRLDVGYQQREMISDSLFQEFVQKSYPMRFRYYQDWKAPDSLPLNMISSGSVGIRDRIISLQHHTDFREKWKTHQITQALKTYYRYPMQGYKVPVEMMPGDTNWLAKAIPGSQPRGFSGELELMEKRKRIEFGLSGIYAMEWELPIFHLNTLDSASGQIVRSGSYKGSNDYLQNATWQLFASGKLGLKLNKNDSNAFPFEWNVQAGWRDFWGKDAQRVEFRPSLYWAGMGVICKLPWDVQLGTKLDYLGEKEVRGWGSVFLIPAHLENNLSFAKSLFKDEEGLVNRIKLSLALRHAFGEDLREQPNGNPLRLRILGLISGAF